MDYAAARLNMVESQIRTNKVTDARIIAAMNEVPRERFVPKQLRGIAYVDEDIHIGNGRHLMEPMVLARLLQTANIGATDIVLAIGIGTGYDAAILSRLAATVVALESDSALAAQATRLLAELGMDNIAVVEGRLEEGYPRQAPYNVIVLCGAVEQIPAGLHEQLAPGGRLVGVLMPPDEQGKAVIAIRAPGPVTTRPVFDAATNPLPGFAREPGFVF